MAPTTRIANDMRTIASDVARVAGGAHCHPIVSCAHSATATTEKIESAAARVARLRRPDPSVSSG